MQEKMYKLEIAMDNGLIVSTTNITSEKKLKLSAIDFTKSLTLAEDNNEVEIVVNLKYARTITYTLENDSLPKD